MAGRTTRWIAVDWGTTHLRAWVFGPDGTRIASLSSADGMGRLSPDRFESALLSLIDPHLPEDRRTPIIACGMVGARQGWVEAPYARTPCPPPGVREAVLAPVRDSRLTVRILPGVSQSAPADVMRGEETQIAGILAENPGFDGVVCLPGTHTKWVHASAGEIVGFRTFMTGELYALLSERSVLKHGLKHGTARDDWDQDAFLEAVDDMMASPRSLAADLFSLRAAALLHDLPPAAARARLSGLLVGSELAGARERWLGRRVVLVGSETLSRLYEAALVAQGTQTERVQGDAMTRSGLAAAWECMSEGVA